MSEGDAVGLFNQAVALQQQGDVAQAIRLYRFALKIDPAFEPAQINLRYLTSGLTIERPRAFEVVQRQAVKPQRAHDPALFEAPLAGVGAVLVQGRFGAYSQATLDARIERFGAQGGLVVDLAGIRLSIDDGAFSTELSVVAGGWYVLHLVLTAPDGTRAEARIGPVGVGELYLIAGQSHAASTSDALLAIDDPAGRIVAWHPNAQYWRVAHDPQPGSDGDAADEREFWKRKANFVTQYGIGGTGGSVWPEAMNRLLTAIDMPIGMINVAESGSPLAAWMPGEKLFERLAQAARVAGRFRAILWAQGESDVMNGVAADSYAPRFRVLRDALAATVGQRADWLVAKSTYLPVVYQKPDEEIALRAALAAVWQEPDVFPGPDTDFLRGANRAAWSASAHFTRAGQIAAGSLWFSALLAHLQARGA